MSSIGLRDFFAGLAMCGLLAQCDEDGINSYFHSTISNTASASKAYEIADAMLKQGGYNG